MLRKLFLQYVIYVGGLHIVNTLILLIFKKGIPGSDGLVWQLLFPVIIMLIEFGIDRYNKWLDAKLQA